MSVREFTMPLKRVMSIDRLGVVPNTVCWITCCKMLLSPNRPAVAKTVFVPPVVVWITPATVEAAGAPLLVDVDVGDGGGGRRVTREGQVAVASVITRRCAREFAAGAADEFASGVACEDRIVAGERSRIWGHGIVCGAVAGLRDVQQVLHVGVGIARQRIAVLVARHEVAGRDDRHVVLIDHLLQGAARSRRPGPPERPGSSGRSTRCIATAWRRW